MLLDDEAIVTVSFCVFINLWPRPWPRPRDDWPRPRSRSLWPRPRPRPHSFWPRPRPWPHELMASLTSLFCDGFAFTSVPMSAKLSRQYCAI